MALAGREVLGGGRVRGSILKTHLQWLAENHEPSDREVLLSRVSEETASVLRAPIQASAWYPFRALVEIDRGIASFSAAGSDATVARELGRYSARQHVTSPNAASAAEGPHAFFISSTRVHAHFVDFGRAEYEATGPQAGRFTLLDYRCFSPMLCWSGQGYYEQAAGIRGGRNPVVRETACVCEGSLACVFEISWS